MAQILVVEDDEKLNALLTEFLSDEGHQITTAHDGLAARTLLEREQFDLVLLDLMLPKLAGPSVLQALRTHSSVPVMVLSARDAVWHKIDLLNLGADDYITKPFDLGEVSARISALLRRSQPAELPDELRHGPIRLNSATKQAWAGLVELNLTVTEFRILELLLEAPARVLSKAAIYQGAWGEPYLGDDSTIKTHLSHLRGKLRAADQDADLIETVWGLGYRLGKPEI